MTYSPDVPVVALVNDMIFAARIRGAAQAAGCGVRTTSKATDVLAAAAAARLILVDLDATRADPVGLIRILKADTTLEARVIAFVSHVNADAIAAARAAGADQVMARSAFVARLPEMFTGL